MSPETPDDTGVQSGGDTPVDARSRRVRDAGTPEWDVERTTDVFGDFEPSDASGRRSPAWVRLVGTDKYTDEMTGVALDDDGGIFVVGMMDDARRNGERRDRLDGYLARFDRSGERKWLKLTGVSGSDTLDHVAVAPDGAVYVAGRSKSGKDVFDNYLASYDSAGAWKSLELTTTADEEVIRDIAVDARGTVYAVGKTDHGYEGQPYHGGDWDAFLMAFE